MIGLSVTLLTLSSTAWPQPFSLVSTSVTPPSVMNTATLPPLKVAGVAGRRGRQDVEVVLELLDVDDLRAGRRRRRLRAAASDSAPAPISTPSRIESLHIELLQKGDST